jgi:hypothetical protein
VFKRFKAGLEEPMKEIRLLALLAFDFCNVHSNAAKNDAPDDVGKSLVKREILDDFRKLRGLKPRSAGPSRLTRRILAKRLTDTAPMHPPRWAPAALQASEAWRTEQEFWGQLARELVRWSTTWQGGEDRLRPLQKVERVSLQSSPSETKI